jgi:hypothetical protein
MAWLLLGMAAVFRKATLANSDAEPLLDSLASSNPFIWPLQESQGILLLPNILVLSTVYSLSLKNIANEFYVFRDMCKADGIFRSQFCGIGYRSSLLCLFS